MELHETGSPFPVVSLALLLPLLVVLPGCDLFGFGSVQQCYVPSAGPEAGGRVVMTAAYDEGEDTAHRLIVTDLQNPSNYRVLRKAGDHVGEAYFGPEKRRIVFGKDARLIEDAGGRLALYDLESNEVRLLTDAPWTGVGGGNVVWEADGSGFYYNTGGAWSLPSLVHYDLEKQKARYLAQRTRIHGLKGRTSMLVYNRRPANEGRFPFYFFDVEKEAYTEHVRNEYLKIVEWEDESRGGHKYAAFGPAYGNETDLIAFRQKSEDEKTRLAITDVEGDCFGTYTDGEYLDYNLDWGPGGTVLFDRHSSPYGSGNIWDEYRVMVLDAGTGEVRRLVDPAVIDGAVGLHSPEY